MHHPVLASVSLIVLFAGCVDGEIMKAAIGNVPKTLVVTSPAFTEGTPIPPEFGCDGQDVSPALQIAGLPKGTRALALIMDDPDAPRGTWTHWTAWNLPANLSEMPEDADPAKMGGRQGVTSAGSIGYHGPCPPGGTHRYFFHVFALDSALDLAEGATRQQLEQALTGKVLAWGELMGTYRRG